MQVGVSELVAWSSRFEIHEVALIIGRMGIVSHRLSECDVFSHTLNLLILPLSALFSGMHRVLL